MQEVEQARLRDADAAGAAIVAGEERPPSEEDEVADQLRDATRERDAYLSALTRQQAEYQALLAEQSPTLAEKAEAEIDGRLKATAAKAKALNDEIEALVHSMNDKLFVANVAVLGSSRVGTASSPATRLTRSNGDRITIIEAAEAIAEAIRQTVEARIEEDEDADA